MADPLAQFRKKPPGAVEAGTAVRQQDEYVAFETKDKVDRLLIRQANAQARSPGYAFLLDIAYDGPYGTNFVLYYSFMMMVLVEGRNLQPVIMALQMGTAEFIQEYSDRWPTPKDEKAPFIQSIKVVVEQGGPSISHSENGEAASGTLH